MKQKLLLALLALFTLGGSNLFAQTDVTSTYLNNPSFEKDGVITTSNGALTLTGWTQSDPGSSYNNTGCYDASTAIPTQGTVTVTPSEGDHFLFFRHGWNGNGANYTFTSSSTTLPAGTYTLTVDYKMIEGYDDTQKNTTSVTLAAVSGENTLGSAKGTTKTNVSKGNDYTYLNTADWNTASSTFALEEETNNVQFVINLFAGGQRRSDFVIDNVKLLFTEFIDPTEISIPSSLSMIVTGKETLTATLTPENANHNTAITWTSSNESVATVADGVVTAVAAGTATITATTANGVSATCEVTVNEAPLANGDYYIMNVATGKFLGGANAWGSQASLIEHGIPFYASLGNGVYKLNSRTYNSDTDHFVGLNGNGDLYLDNAGTGLYITALGAGKYSISTANGSAYLTANNENTIVGNSAENTNSELAQWMFFTKDELESVLANATTDSPVDATFYIADQNFSRNYWPAGRNKSSWTMESTNQNLKGGNNENMCAESYHATFTLSQKLTVKNGMYKLRAQACENVSSPVAVVYANNETTPFKAMTNSENSMGACSTSFSDGNYYTDWITVNVTDNTLTVGVKSTSSSNWCVWDNFELYYYGPNLADVATEIPMDIETAMTTDSWFYFDIPVNGLYNLTTTNISDIVYTTDGTILIENQSSVTSNFVQAENAELTAGRYYVKSASAQSLKVTVGAYAYNVGAATLSVADGGYTQSSTFTVTFPAAATSDPDGAAAFVASSTATVNGSSVALTAVENGFSLDLGTLTESTDYVIAIPASVYGYADHSMNEAINITIHTPAVFDGEYVLYDENAKLFLGRGAAYGTEAVVDKYGIPFALATDATGISSFKFVDNDQYLFSNNKGVAAGIYTDAASTGWNIIAATDGYILKDANGDVYAKVENGSLGLYAHTVEGSENATVWTFKTKAERDAIIAVYPADNINNVITASGVSTTADAFETYLSENYKAVDYTDAIGTATFAGAVGDWTWSSTWRNQDGQPAYGTGFVEAWNATGAWSQTISKDNLPAGIYKVTVQGYERRKANDAATALYSAGYNLVSTFLSANDEQVRFTDWNDVADKPTNTAGAVTAFTNGEAINEVYVYLDGNTDLTLTVKKPNYIWDCWVIWNNVTLTRYVEAANITIKAGRQYTAFSYDKPLDFTGSELTAEIVTSATGTTQKVTKVPAKTGIIVGLAEATTEAKTISVPVCAGETDDVTDNKLVAVLEATTIPQTVDGNINYVFGKSGGKEQFFKVRTAGMEVPANNAYLAIPKAQAKGIDVIGLNGDATGISTIENADMQNSEVYNLQGQKVNRAQKGVYIVNGKKIVKK